MWPTSLPAEGAIGEMNREGSNSLIDRNTNEAKNQPTILPVRHTEGLHREILIIVQDDTQKVKMKIRKCQPLPRTL